MRSQSQRLWEHSVGCPYQQHGYGRGPAGYAFPALWVFLSSLPRLRLFTYAVLSPVLRAPRSEAARRLYTGKVYYYSDPGTKSQYQDLG